ncbi:hypothetical protein HY483_00410 [Candidatus Woesearchaeota archaeon]|nr:hypothetical protein [Candidatus Woesearchaeota archaeon]
MIPTISETQERAYQEASPLDKLRMDIHSMIEANTGFGKMCPWDDQNYDTCANCERQYDCTPRALLNNPKDVLEWIIHHDPKQKTIASTIAIADPNTPLETLKGIATESFELWRDQNSDASFTYLRKVRRILEEKINRATSTETPSKVGETIQEEQYRNASIWDKYRMDIHAMSGINPKTAKVCQWDTPENAQNYSLCKNCPHLSNKCAPGALRELEIMTARPGKENLREKLITHNPEDDTLFPLIIRVVSDDPVEALRLIATNTVDLYLHNGGFDTAVLNIKNARDILDEKMVHIREADRLLAEAAKLNEKAKKHFEEAKTFRELLDLFDSTEGDEKYKNN